MQIKKLSEKFINDLNSLYQEEEAQALFLLAVDHILRLSRTEYLMRKTDEVLADDLPRFELVLKDLCQGKPIQYILGQTYFFGLPIKVNPAVLIPRPETEELVDWVMTEVVARKLLLPTSLNPEPSLSILDIGTGSGCIAIALKKNLSISDVYGLDIAADSLAVATENAELNEVEIEFIKQDILSAMNWQPRFPLNIIVSNPPYVKEDEKFAMHQNVLANEPHRALFVSNENPLVFYLAIADFAVAHLKTNGLLFLEINEYLAKETMELLKDKGFVNILLKKDMQGKKRMIMAMISDETA